MAALEVSRVIVADVARGAAEELSAFLESRGVEARAVYDGGDAIIAAESWPASGAVLASPLPGVSAVDAARHLRESFGPGFGLVAYPAAVDGDAELLKRAGFDRVVPRKEPPEKVFEALSDAGRALVMRSVAQSTRRIELLIVLGHSLLGRRQLTPSSANEERARRIVALVESDIARLPGHKERERLTRELQALAERVRLDPSFQLR
ncbi:MAG TPA: hypothetical protein VH301_15185 [Usitatibacter sp.]|nr:hypothetical protein [Usitatibacter sp.]